MTKVTLKSAMAWKANQTNNIAIVGDVTFDDQAQIEVDADVAQELIETMPEFSIVNGIPVEPVKEEIKTDEPAKEVEKSDEPDITPQVEELDLGKADEEGTLNPQTEESEILGSATTQPVAEIPVPAVEEVEAVIEVPDLAEKLAEKTNKELKEMVAQFDAEKAKELNKKSDLVDFLIEKLA